MMSFVNLFIFVVKFVLGLNSQDEKAPVIWATSWVGIREGEEFDGELHFPMGKVGLEEDGKLYIILSGFQYTIKCADNAQKWALMGFFSGLFGEETQRYLDMLDQK